MEDVVRIIFKRSVAAAYKCGHIVELPATRLELARRVLEAIDRRLGGDAIAVLDENLVPVDDRILAALRRGLERFRWIKFGDSRDYIGIQLADLLAGYYYSKLYRKR